MAWRANEVADDAPIPLDDACLRELADDDAPLSACQALADRVRVVLDDGLGYAVVEGFPLDGLDDDAVRQRFRRFAGLVARPVEQNYAGRMIWEVRDTGQVPMPGSGIRASQSNLGQQYHTDNLCGVPPDYVALLCLQPAMEGGESGLISFDEVHNRLLAERPGVLKRLYQPFYIDRQRDHAPEDKPVIFEPVFTYDGETLKARFCPFQIRQGYALVEDDLDEAGEAAIEAMNQVMATPGLDRTFNFQRGQVQFVNNRRIGHRRTAYTDWPEPERKRHLVRLWLRHAGDARYMG